MQVTKAVFLLVFAAIRPVVGQGAETDAAFEFVDGDRIVWLGNTLIEREQRYGDSELMLTLANRDKHLVFRNLGWSADTVWADSRGIFDPPAKGYERMIRQVHSLQPTVMILGYGGVEAFDGPGRLAAFERQYRVLLEDLKPIGCRFVLLSPTVMEVSSLPSVPGVDSDRHASEYARNVDAICGVLQTLCDEYQATFVDIRPALQGNGSETLTDNGLHLNANGYARTGRLIATALSPAHKLDGIDFGSPEVEELRQTIREKNQLYFHRWRPQNFTYLFGFRQHEQGNNAVEIPQFDPLVEKAEKRIDELRSIVFSR